jgi:hypothetical protein
MIDTGVWDETCRIALGQPLAEAHVLDGFTLMLFGGPFSTDNSTIAAMVDYDRYVELVRQRLKSGVPLEPTVAIALQQASGEDT